VVVWVVPVLSVKTVNCLDISQSDFFPTIGRCWNGRLASSACVNGYTMNVGFVLYFILFYFEVLSVKNGNQEVGPTFVLPLSS